jgi:hypothetical protein
MANEHCHFTRKKAINKCNFLFIYTDIFVVVINRHVLADAGETAQNL